MWILQDEQNRGPVSIYQVKLKITSEDLTWIKITSLLIALTHALHKYTKLNCELRLSRYGANFRKVLPVHLMTSSLLQPELLQTSVGGNLEKPFGIFNI